MAEYIITKTKTKGKPQIREKAIEKGFSCLSDTELYMLILGAGQKNIPVENLANKVQQVIQISNDLDILQEKLSNIRGIGTSKSFQLCAVLEISKRLASLNKAKIKSPEDIIPMVKSYSLETQEHFLSISLNGAHEIIKIRVVGVGSLTKVHIHPRDVFAEPLKEKAAALIVCHNHPSGNCEPSSEDIQITKRLFEVSQILGIVLLDHLILTQTDYFSFLGQTTIFQE